jgi:hypothetical protein
MGRGQGLHLQPPKDRMHIGDGGSVAKAVQDGAALRAVAQLDFAQRVIVGKDIGFAADRQPQQVGQRACMRLELEGAGIRAPDDAAEQGQDNAFDMVGMRRIGV